MHFIVIVVLVIANHHHQTLINLPTPKDKLLDKHIQRRAYVGLLIAPQLSRDVFEFTLVNKRVASLRLQVGYRSLIVISGFGSNSGAEYTAFLKLLGGVLDALLIGDFWAAIVDRERRDWLEWPP